MGVRAAIPGTTLNDLIAYAKANPGKTYYGSQGVGGGNHMAAMLFGKHIGADLKHVPFPGAGPAGQALLKGEIDFFMAPLAVLLPWYRSSEIKILAMGSQQRAKDAPDVPTFRELGYPDDFILTVWSVIVGPPGIPSAISEKLNVAFAEILNEPKVRERFSQLAVDPGGGDMKSLEGMLLRETKTWTRVAAENNIAKE
jgi:tripartite-type tricarboxylate transporter receptor subunit TctC